MREPLFLKNNRKKWKEYEENLFHQQADDTDPDHLANLYIQLTDDLSYSRTFYPRSMVVKYLNGLAARTHLLIYKNKKDRSSFADFFMEELPFAFYQARYFLLIAFLVFMFSATLGWISTVYDTGIAAQFLGDEYVEMTIENIKNNNPTGVYDGGDEVEMFLHIAANNIFVTFRLFCWGLFFMVGAIVELFRNAFMVGTFLALFYNHGQIATAFPIVMIHGTLELSGLVIAGAAGMMLSSGFMFPGTFTRMEAFQKTAKEAGKIILGLVPVFTIAAFFEGYVTRHAEMPLIFKLMIIIVSSAYILGYYVVLPFLLFHHKPHSKYGQN
jgi:uncharacterized membrane protein SpoIIM required for sporulation